jgi:hypothetical protein
LCRNNIYYSLRSDFVFQEEVPTSNFSPRFLINAANNIAKSIFHLIRLRKVDGIVFADSGKRYLNGHFVDIYTNFFFKSDDFSWLSAERSVSFSHKNPIAISNYFYLDFIEFTSKIFGYISRFWILSSNERKKIILIENLVRINWGVNISLYNNFKSTLFSYKYVYRLCDHVLSLTCPRVLVFVQYYTLVNSVFVKLARVKGIPTVELQHGYCGEYHINYSFGHDGILNFFPDNFFAWGPFWLRNSTLSKQTKIYLTGFPFFDEAKSVCDGDTVINNGVLVLSQCRSDLAELVCGLADRYPLISFTYKLHPSETVLFKNIAEQMALRENIVILDDNHIYSLYKCFRTHSIVLSTGSTGLIEALQCDCRVLIPKLEGWQYYQTLLDQSLVSNSLVYFFEGVDDFGECLEFDVPASLSRLNYFFNSNSHTNIIDNINSLI